MPWVPWERTPSAIAKASSMVVFFSAMSSSLSLGMTIMVSTQSERVLMPSSALFLRLRPSKVKGLVTTATVSAPTSFIAISATIRFTFAFTFNLKVNVRRGRPMLWL